MDAQTTDHKEQVHAHSPNVKWQKHDPKRHRAHRKSGDSATCPDEPPPIRKYDGAIDVIQDDRKNGDSSK
jgi:hypothetical protein